MCGILLEYRYDRHSRIDLRRFQQALDLQRHRGPDDSGIHADGNVVLGHRRLSIIDPTPHARQPMVSECGNYILLFNGEIYNYRELRRDLERRGVRFRTESDTEVLLNLYIREGSAALQQLIGMFAFAVYDRKRRSLFVARDRLGIKPLHLYRDRDRIILSSEIKSILALGGIERRLDLTAIPSYLAFRYPITDSTFFEGVESLPPAHYMEITPERTSSGCYWEPSELFNRQREDRGEEFYRRRLRELLEDAVTLRMRSDVPLGAFLSGGVDSSVVTALMARSHPEPVKTFTIGFREENFNEFSYADLIARHYGTEHREILLSGMDYLREMEKLITIKDAPLAVPNEVPLYLMSRELKRHITVVLSGEGADELFGGYGRIFRSPCDYERMLRLHTSDWSPTEKKQFTTAFRQRYGRESFSDEFEHFLANYAYTSFPRQKNLLHPSLDLDGLTAPLQSKLRETFYRPAEATYTDRISYTFEKIHLPGLLQRLDTTTMAASVEARAPFTDHRLVEFAFTLPLKYKLKWKSERCRHAARLLTSDRISEEYDIPKYLLKKSFQPLVHSQILYRKKMGFPVPLDRWFSGDFNRYAREVLLDRRTLNRKIYNGKELETLLSPRQQPLDRSTAMTLWMMINLELFIRRYFDENLYGAD